MSKLTVGLNAVDAGPDVHCTGGSPVGRTPLGAPKVTAARRATRSAVARMLQPRSIAIVGLSDNKAWRTDGLRPTLDSDCDVFIVNPNHETVLGRATAPSLTELGRPVDCVLSVMSAERSVALAEEAAGLDIGGLVVIAAGFAEAGPEGAQLQERLRRAADLGGFAAVGPNCLGWENVPRSIRLTSAVKEDHNIGGLSIVSQSGAVLSGVTIAGNAAGAGFNILISCGNEAVNDVADYIDFLADDPGTTAIGLVIEKIRRPAAFFAAVRKATAAGKPIVALKLARNERSQRMATSHTGALVGDAWVYEVALRQFGVALARDPDELADRLALADQLPPERWTRVDSLGSVNLSGGFASLTYDVAKEEGITLPALDALLPWVQSLIPGALVANPLDPTGLGTEHWRELLEGYITSPLVDAFYLVHPMSTDDVVVARYIVPLGEIAATVDKPVVLANVSGLPPAFTRRHAGSGVAFGGGVRSSLRGLQTIGNFVKHREQTRRPVEPKPQIPRPAASTLRGSVGEMLSFEATMQVLRAAGIPVAPFELVREGEALPERMSFPGPYVVKLADVEHRTDIGAVMLGVDSNDLATAIADLHHLSSDKQLPPAVAVQPMLPATGELFVGIQGMSELGPMVVLGLGGVFVEALHRVGGRLAPFDVDEARSLIEEFADTRIMHGFRGAPAWPLEALAKILVAAGDLASAGSDWISSLDLNPVLYAEGAYTAVDALLLVKG